jgi:hypothetical protein
MSIRTACALALVSAVALAAAAPAPAAQPAPPKPHQLWNKFPLGTQQLTGTTPTTPVRTATRPTKTRPTKTTPTKRARPPVATTPPRSSGLPAPSAFVLGAAVLLLAVAAFVVVRVYMNEDVAEVAEEDEEEAAEAEEEEDVTTALVTSDEPAAQAESPPEEPEFVEQPVAWHNFSSTQGRGTGMTDQLDEGVVTPAPGSEDPRVNHAEVGDRVSGVIKAAEEAAEQIRADAHAEAATIKHEAEEAAVKAIREAAKERDELRAASEAAAETMRIENDNYATGLKCEAEAEAARLIVEGEAQARALREAAEQMALTMEANALRRRDEIEDGTRTAEAQLRRFQLGLASISEHLDGLLEPPQGERVETLSEALAVDLGQTPRQ